MVAARPTLAVILAALALAGCGGDDGGGGKPEPEDVEDVLNHYLCYQVALDRQFKPPKGTVRLLDQFRQEDPVVTVGRRVQLCNPVRKGRERPPLPQPEAHLLCYAIEGPAADVEKDVSNQFNPRAGGVQQVVVTNTDTLCLPTGKTKDLHPKEPPRIPEGVDHFKCYTAFTRTRLKPFKVTLEDQFFSGQARVVNLRELCNPADKTVDGEPKGTRKNPRAHLACYSVQAEAEVRGALVVNQFEHGNVVTVIELTRLCVPSTKEAAGANPPEG